MGDNLTTDVHERVDQLVEPVCGARKRNDKGRAIEVFVSEVKESHDAVERQNDVNYIILFLEASLGGSYLSRSMC